jgi:hypothetical protein
VRESLTTFLVALRDVGGWLTVEFFGITNFHLQMPSEHCQIACSAGDAVIVIIRLADGTVP